MMPDFDIIFEDTHLIVLSKPCGLLSQGNEQSHNHHLVGMLRIYLGRPYVGLIHRLDRNTSGIMLIGKRTKSSQRLSKSLQQGKIKRTYLGWVIGKLPAQVTWEHFIEKDREKNKTKIVSPQVKNHAHLKNASLSAKAIRRAYWCGEIITLAEFELKTGRSHQIRVQSAHEGFPILGDLKYSSYPFKRMALHSYSLEFPHPMSHKVMRFTAPLPKMLNFGSLTPSLT